MARRRPQREWAQLWDEMAAGLDGRAAAFSEVPGPALGTAPRQGGWSIGQVFEHLCLSADSYLGFMRQLTADPRSPGATPDTHWKPSLAGRLMLRSMRSVRLRMPAPGMWLPSRPREDVVGEFRKRNDEVVALSGRAVTLDWRRLKAVSPVSRLVRLDLGDCFAILLAHAERHMLQAERVRASLA